MNLVYCIAFASIVIGSSGSLTDRYASRRRVEWKGKTKADGLTYHR